MLDAACQPWEDVRFASGIPREPALDLTGQRGEYSVGRFTIQRMHYADDSRQVGVSCGESVSVPHYAEPGLKPRARASHPPSPSLKPSKARRRARLGSGFTGPGSGGLRASSRAFETLCGGYVNISWAARDPRDGERDLLWVLRDLN